MAVTQISDVFVPDVYQSYSAVNNPETTAFFDSGVAVRNQALGGMFSEGGSVATLPFWKDLDPDDEPNISNDDPNDLAVPAKVTTGKQVAHTANLNQGYSSADLTADLAGTDPMLHVRNRFGNYWQRQSQRRLLATVRGVVAGNIANDGGDMVRDISGATNGDVDDGTLFGRQAFVDTSFTMGDQSQSLLAIAVHSVVYARMVSQQDIDFIPDANGQMTVPTYLGKRVIVDDGMPVIPAAGAGATDAAAKYHSYIFAGGAIGYDELPTKTPVELEREPRQGNGGGVETLWERVRWVMHPFGFAFDAASVAGESPTLAELRDGAMWDRVIDRKLVPIAALITNG